MLYRNLFLDQPVAWQLAKIGHQRRTQLLLEIDIDRVVEPLKHRIVSDSLPRRDVHSLAPFIQVHARASFQHSKFNDAALVNMPQDGCARDRRSHRTHLDLRAAGLFGDIKQKLSATEFDRSRALADRENG